MLGSGTIIQFIVLSLASEHSQIRKGKKANAMKKMKLHAASRIKNKKYTNVG